MGNRYTAVMNLLKYLLVGAASFYRAQEGDVLYCNHLMPEAVYSMDTGPWVALDVGAYGRFADCGDWLSIKFSDGTYWKARALDAGNLAGWQIDTTADGRRDTNLIIDIPDLWRPDGKMSWPVTVVNLSKIQYLFDW